jgi:serine/threonine protein kinase
MGQILRDHAYVSPEQLRGDRHLDARTDVYSLAAVAYYALTGYAPAEEYVSARTRQPELPAGIDAVLETAMSKLPGQRFHTAGQFAAALRIALEACRGKHKTRRMFLPRWSWVTAAVCVVICGIALWLAYSQTTNVVPKHASNTAVKSVSVAASGLNFFAIPHH